MKKIIGCVILTVFMSGCRKEFAIDFYYVNQSGVDIIMSEIPHWKINDIAIANGDCYIYGYLEPRGWPWPFGDASAARIEFGGEKFILYENDLSKPPCGVFDLQNYEIIEVNSKYYKYYFYITPEMYERAEPISE